jgi:(p)ppGpp synthase/HD superfamily hydrolase
MYGGAPMTIAYEAMIFAREVHKDQRRKYTGNPYVDHLAEVAGIIATVPTGGPVFQDYMIATAWLHDCVEDQGVTETTLFERFGWAVTHAVLALSDMEVGNRAVRKAASRVRLAAAPAWVQTIKCADLISNTSSIVEHDRKFAAVYLEEKRLLLDVMTRADPRLVAIARAQTQAG